MERQISIDDYLRQTAPPVKIKIPMTAGDHCFTIPADVWENRCRLCMHKNAAENIPIPKAAAYKPYYEDLLPCRIITICRAHDKPGECMSFAPRMGTYGICDSCRHNNPFTDGYCMKEDHAEQRRVYYGQGYSNPDYWGRHRLSVCDDYEPDLYTDEGRR